MPGFETLLAFLLATAIFAYMPGPAMLYASAQTIAAGRKAGWMAALGIHIGGYAHVIAAALGLAVLFTTVPLLYALVKIIGAVYLIWLGLRMLLSRASVEPSSANSEDKSWGRAFWQSVTVEVLNPKTALFFLAFLPQFTDPAAALPVWLQLLILGTIVNAMFSSADLLCVLLADKLTGTFKRSQLAGRMARRLGGGLIVALGINLAVSRQ